MLPQHAAHTHALGALVHASLDAALLIDPEDGAIMELNEAADTLLSETFPEQGVWTLATVAAGLHDALLVERRRSVLWSNWRGAPQLWQVVPMRHDERGVLFVTIRPASARELDMLASARSGQENHAEVSGQTARALLRHTRDVVATMNARGRVTYVSPAIEHMLGVTAETFTRRGGPLMHPEDTRRVGEALAQLITRTGAEAELSYRARHADGTWRALSCTVRNMLHDEEVGALLLHMRDETEQVRTVKELRRRERQLNTSQRITNVGSWEWTVQTEVMELSEEMRRMFGLPSCERVTSPERLLELVHDEDRTSVMRRLSALADGEAPSEMTYRIVRPDGATRIIMSRAEITARHGERVRRVSGTARDITELRRSEDELRAYAHQLEESNCALREFAYVASHDLKEPLRKIRMFGDRLATTCGDHLPQQGNAYLSRMQRATVRMGTLIDDLLSYAQLSTTGRPFVSINLNELVSDVVDDLECRILESGAHIEQDPLPAIQGDPVQLRQVFQNLIANALKFHAPGEAPSVSIHGQLHTTHPLGPGAWLEIFVEDEGIGFEQKHADAIFAPFQRLHTRSCYEGSGIGLAICRKIVERHGGRINVCSTPGDGSTFFMLLPIDQPAPRASCPNGCAVPDEG